MNLSNEHQEELEYARSLLESPSFARKLTELLGTPIERGFEMLPKDWNELVQKATEKALRAALEVSMQNLERDPKKPPENLKHKLLSAASGAAGGAFGILSLPFELPITTIIMLRSIADIARSQQADLSDPETKLACLEVFALGGETPGTSTSDANYYITRTASTRVLTNATQYLATFGLAEEGSSILMRLVATLAARFGAAVSQKVAATAIPVIGAASGAIVNTLFMDHFQTVAQGHFTIRRLEKEYGSNLVQQEYQKIPFVSQGVPSA